MIESVEKLLEEKKYKQAKIELNKLNSSDVAELLEDIDSKEIIKVFRLINKDKAAEVFAYLPVEQETERDTKSGSNSSGKENQSAAIRRTTA